MLKSLLRPVLANSFAAGVCIGIGGAVYLSVADKVVGAVLFSVALLTICLLGLHLFTGRIGSLATDASPKNLASLGLCLFGNLAGTGFAAALVWLASPSLSEVARVACLSRLERSVPSVLAAAFFCGILMYVAVTASRTRGTVAAIFLCVPVFILSGFEHSVADMFYFWLSGVYTWQTLLFLLLAVAGNTLGACLLPFCKKIAGETV